MANTISLLNCLDAPPANADHRAVARRAARKRRTERIAELLPQVKGLIAQGYHLLPNAPGEERGPAEDLSDLCRELGECYHKNGQHEAAVHWCRQAVMMNERNLMARCYLVGGLCEMGHYDEARRCYEETPGDVLDRNVVRGWLDGPIPEAPAPQVVPARAHKPSVTVSPDGRTLLRLVGAAAS